MDKQQETRLCPGCRKTFTPKYPSQRACDLKCINKLYGYHNFLGEEDGEQLVREHPY